MTRTQAPVLYLDFDGVLHPDEAHIYVKKGPRLHGPGALFMWAPLVAEALAPYPQVQVVLSTSWVTVMGFHRARRHLPAALRDRVVGATWHSSFPHDHETRYWWEDANRCDQILADVLRRRPSGWLAVDDAVQGWDPAYADHLVACDARRGLSEAHTLARLHTQLERLVQGHLPLPVPFASRRRPFPAMGGWG